MKPIRILYDEWGFQETHGGVSRLFSEVMKNLPEGFEWILPQTSTVNEYLRNPPFNLPSADLTFRDFVRDTLHGHFFPGANRLYRSLGHLLPRQFPAYEVVSRQERIAALKKGDYDIYHLTAAHWKSYDWKVVAGRKPIVVTVCDLIPEVVGHDAEMMRYRRPLLQAASHIIAITEYTKNDLIRLYGLPPEKISVVYLGANMGVSRHVRSESVGMLAEGEPFALFVGKRGGYKNFMWLVTALAPLLKTGLKLFCTGVPFNREEGALFEQLGVSGQVLQKFVSDNELQWLYAHACCFIHPSLYEGFGIPILDAFAAGCPAVVANASCFPEVAGDAARYFDPRGDGADLRKIISEYIGSGGEKMRNTSSVAGRSRVAMFSWQKCARMTADVYRMLVRR